MMNKLTTYKMIQIGCYNEWADMIINIQIFLQIQWKADVNRQS